MCFHKKRMKAQKALCVLLAAAGFGPAILEAQQAQGTDVALQSLWGETRAVGSFDPTARPIPPRVPIGPGLTEVPRPRAIPQSEYELRKRIVARTPGQGASPDPRISFALGSLSYNAEPLQREPLLGVPSKGFLLLPNLQFQPPSPVVAAGPEDLLEIVNSFLARFDKTTGQNTFITNLNQFFNASVTTWCPSLSENNCLLADPQIRYDQWHGRFIITAQARDSVRNTSHFLIAVSNGATFLSGFKTFALDAQQEGSARSTFWADFPQVGFDDKALYITALMFNSAFTYQYSKVRIIKKSDLYNPNATTLPWREFNQLRNHDETLASTLQPVHARGRIKLGSEPALLINTSDLAGAEYFTLWRINNPISDNPTLTRFTITGVWPYDYPASATQLGSPVLLDTGASSILKAVYRDGFVWVAYNAKHSDAPTTVAYARINLETNRIVLQARWLGGQYFYPAFDVPASLGPANALTRQFVGTTTNSIGGLTYAGITSVKEGEDIFDVTVGATARWGDYFGASIDPVDGGMWVSGQYARRRVGGIGQYASWGAYFPWSTDQQFADVGSNNPFFHFVNVAGLWGVSNGCSARPANYCPTGTVTREQMAAFVIRSIYGELFTIPGEPYFTDVPQTSPFFKYIQKLREVGITTGCAENRFCPTEPTTRGQMAAFLMRAKLAPLFGANFAAPTTPYFTDVPSTDPFFRHVQKLREMGITTGCTTNQYCPSDPVTREQMAAFLIRAFFN
jgi:hypothetical protein